MLDLHTHILPHMDDGSRSLQQSIRMLRREAKHGVTRVVLSSHFYPDKESPERFLKRRAAVLPLLAQKVDRWGNLPEIIPGAEVAYFKGISRVEGIERLCIGNSKAILIEMPFCRWDQSTVDEIIFLRSCLGFRPIIAHIERYMRYQPKGTLGRLRQEGVWIQANAEFFTNWQTSWLAMRMLKKHTIQFLGSDCHRIRKRPPNMDAALARIEKRLGNEGISYLKCMEQRLLEGE